MRVNEKNLGIASEISDILENEKCTVDETREILMFLISISGEKSTVQMKDVISQRYKEAQKADPAEF